MNFTEWDFKHCMGSFASGVTVITAKNSSNLIGVTVSAFTSLSLKPPMVLFCLDKTTKCRKVFEKSEFFAINILEESQEEISRRFASNVENRFEGIAYSQFETGCPIIDGVRAYVECKKKSAYDGGDHIIFTGEVINLHHYPEKRPLLYYSGSYGKYIGV